MAERFLDVLAWDLVACSLRPPLHPTTCAVLRLLAAVPVMRFQQFMRLMPCAEETVRQQLNRLVWRGLVHHEVRVRMGRRALHLYWLTVEGREMLRKWQLEHGRMVERLRGLDKCDG